MNKKQLFALYTCFLFPYIIGNSALTFLPIYAERLGASASIIGYYLATAFAALAIGTMSAGWFSERFQNRKAFVFVGIIGSAIGSIGMGIVPNLLLLTVTTSFIWFCGGLLTAMVLILTGLFVEAERRGRTFGLLTTAMALGAVIGGSYAGEVVERWDYTGLFIFNGVIYIIPLVVALFLEDKPTSPKMKRDKQKGKAVVNVVFWLLFVGSILIYTASFATSMILPLHMRDYDLGAKAIASTVAVTGIFNLPLPFIVGWLSDRVGRKWLLVSSYGFGVVGLLIMIFSSVLWHFWLSRIFIGLIGTGFALGSALITDIVEAEELDSALSRFATTTWIGGVIGYLLTGVAVDHFGIFNTLWMGFFVGLIAAGLIVTIRTDKKTQVAFEAS